MKELLKEQMKLAMKASDKPRLATIRSLMSVIQYQEMESPDVALTSSDYTGLVQREIKKLREGLEYAEKAARIDEIAALNQEIETLNTFLPRQLSESDLTGILGEFRQQHPNTGLSEAMKYLKENYGGQYDGKVASSLIKSL